MPVIRFRNTKAPRMYKGMLLQQQIVQPKPNPVQRQAFLQRLKEATRHAWIVFWESLEPESGDLIGTENDFDPDNYFRN